MESTQGDSGQRWQYFFEDQLPRRGRLDPFISHLTLLNLAELFPEKSNVAQATNWRVSDFSGWIHMLYVGTNFKGRLWEGRGAHIEVSASRKASNRHRVAPPAANEWTCVHDDLKGNATDNFVISPLSIGGRPMYGCPDLIFLNASGTSALILEVKTTDATLPKDGWPDLRAQLWAYSKMDRFAGFLNVQLAAEIWDRTGTRLRHTYQWSPENERMRKGGEEMFAAFSNAVVGNSID